MLCVVLHCLIWGLLFLSVLVLCKVSSGYVSEQELRLFQMSYTIHFISRRKFMLQWVSICYLLIYQYFTVSNFLGVLMPTNLIFLCWCFCEGLLKSIFASLVLGSGLEESRAVTGSALLSVSFISRIVFMKICIVWWSVVWFLFRVVGWGVCASFFASLILWIRMENLPE